MSKTIIPPGFAKPIAIELKAVAAYGMPGIGYQLYVNVAGEMDPQAQYWYEIRPGKGWESKCNRFGQKGYLPEMDKEMERVLKVISHNAEIKRENG